MTREQERQLKKLIDNPPLGSKIAEARDFGVDLYLNLRRLTLTPTQRMKEMQGALEFAERLRHASRERA